MDSLPNLNPLNVPMNPVEHSLLTMARTGVRSRTGCFTCRQRKKKCNEEKPICSGCRRNCLECFWPPSSNAKSGSARKSTAERLGGTSRSLQPSACDDSRPMPERNSTTVDAPRRTHRRAPQEVSDSYQNDSVPISGSPSGSKEIPQQHTAFGQPQNNSLPNFLVSDLDNTQIEQGSYLFTPARHGWNSVPGDLFDVNSEDGMNTREPLETAARYSTLVAFAFDPETSEPPSEEPVTRESNATLASHNIDPCDDTVNDVCSVTCDSVDGHTVIDVPSLATCGAFAVPNEADLGPGHIHTDLNTCATISPSIPGRVSLFPQQDPEAFHLLSYYLSRTANSMGNGSTDSNPFLSTLVPLAFSDQLVLQLILAQSAVHRQVGQAHLMSDQVAQRYYTGSLRLFRSAIGQYMSGKSTDKLVLTTGSLILSLTEVARGDINGNIFDHIIAAKSLLVELSIDSGTAIPQDFMDFLIEYYTHMSVLSMISVDPQHCTNPLLDVSIEKLARKLIEKKYIGQLCGCWLELLLAIPHIFDVGQRMRGPQRPSPDDITMFALLQAQIKAFEPESTASEETRLAGLVFKNATLLYLWSSLGCDPSDDASSLHSNLMGTAVIDGITLLKKIPATSRVNTSLCWPLIIIGCCTKEKTLQGILRTRLQDMFSCIGLGNMGETLLLLELVWALTPDQRSPWLLCGHMQDHQRWVSFA